MSPLRNQSPKKDGARLLGVAPVAARDLGTAQADLAAFAGRERAAGLVADLDLDVGQRAADGADLLDLAAGLHQRVAAAGLGHAEAVDVAALREEAGEGADAGLGRALAAADHPAQAGDVVGVALGVGEDAAQHDRGEPGAGQPLLGDGRERAGGIEVAQDRDGAADPQHGHARQVEGADVIERAGDEQPVVGAEAERQRRGRRFSSRSWCRCA